jgi:hypothetical protein
VLCGADNRVETADLAPWHNRNRSTDRAHFFTDHGNAFTVAEPAQHFLRGLSHDVLDFACILLAACHDNAMEASYHHGMTKRAKSPISQSRVPSSQDALRGGGVVFAARVFVGG